MQDREQKIRERAYEIWDREGRPLGRELEHWAQAEREVAERELAAREIDQGEGEIEGDDLPSLQALREAARQHADAYIVKTDLEDADQREAAPGTREQP
ncbi:DUF2934 domain-containing protein [Rhizobium sp. TRM96647]|uniref:DUF2934 domain-containing protein n=1 Tax=unclassified Rhizobium TaxID=2613769 RepID=UPI0021E98D66|nr:MULTISPECIES: DUF2934 domain-containing protein [unclassified Rhizobium]MCV3736936.1 DUF2934 domain-containing protein [Rhizobium sp. TRM96647]MCV3756664.1 DUF2934 domain-containing protein [Rhizobium sp. TRM96650]